MSAPDLSSVEHPSWSRVAPWDVRDLTSRFDVPSPTEVACPGCGNYYHARGIGTHWDHSPECRPSLTDRQRELVTGLLMGDGSLDRSDKNPHLKVQMITPKYLAHLDREFNVLGTGVRSARTAVESARDVRARNFQGSDAAVENYSDKYAWKTRNLPELHDFDWYGSGSKVWPETIDLTPTVLRTWYCGDGTWKNHRCNNAIRIAMANEVEHTDKVDSIFERAGLPTPSRYDIREHEDHINCDAAFGVEDSRELFRYMGSPPPGFEYKWGHHAE